MPEQELENTNSQNGEEYSQEETQEEEQPQQSSQESTEESSNEQTQDDSSELTERERQFLARAKKAESKLKETKSEQSDSKKTNEQTDDSLSRDEAVLIAKGMDEERLDVLKRLQAADYYRTGEKKPLTDYQEDSAFKAVDEKLQEEEKKQKAQAVSNRGGTSPKEEIKPGMSEEEHRKVWEKYQK